MSDRIYNEFLKAQLREGMQLNEESDRVEVLPIPRGDLPPNRYIARFDCRGRVRIGAEVQEATSFTVMVRFNRDHLRRIRPWETVAVVDPVQIEHPNVSGHAICVGRLLPGSTLVDCLTQVYEILTFKNVTMREDDCLNRGACAWARDNKASFPTDDRPLRRRRLELQIANENRAHLLRSVFARALSDSPGRLLSDPYSNQGRQ